MAVTVPIQGAPTWSRRRRIGHYGGAHDKRDTSREKTPYAWTWYQQLKQMRGSAYTQDRGTLVHVEDVAIARMFAGITRAAERLECNSIPLTSDERLAYWVEVLRVPVGTDDTRQEVRVRSAAKYRAAAGPDPATVDRSIGLLLGDNYVRTWRWADYGLASPPDPTFWPGVNDGPASYDLGGGTWLSHRAHLTVEVKRVNGQSDGDFLRLVNQNLFQLLDRQLNSHVTFNWALDVDDGFHLDLDEMDYVGFDDT